MTQDAAAPPPPAARYEAEARAWDAAGRPPTDPSVWRTAVLALWMQSDGAKRSGVSPVLEAYLAACRATLDAAHPGWFDGLFDDHETCVECGERYRMENLGICTDCGALYCYHHRGLAGRAPNGNERCARCLVGEVVG